MLSYEPDDILLGLRQALLLLDTRPAIRRAAAVVVVGGGLGCHSVVVVADSVAIVGYRDKSVGVSGHGGGRLAILSTVSTGELGIPVLSSTVSLHVATVYNGDMVRVRTADRSTGISKPLVRLTSGPLTQMQPQIAKLPLRPSLCSAASA